MLQSMGLQRVGRDLVTEQQVALEELLQVWPLTSGDPTQGSPAISLFLLLHFCFFWPCLVACKILISDQRSKPSPLQWNLATFHILQLGPTGCHFPSLAIVCVQSSGGMIRFWTPTPSLCEKGLAALIITHQSFFWLRHTACRILFCDQGLNPGHGNESPESQPLDLQRITHHSWYTLFRPALQLAANPLAQASGSIMSSFTVLTRK